MLTLAMRTDKPLAELYLYENGGLLAEYSWEAHRQLSSTLHGNIDKLFTGCGKSISELEKVAIYQGPGSFTGLRIGFSVANAIGYSIGIPVVAAEGDDWLEQTLANDTQSFVPAYPKYGNEPNITKPKK